MQLRAGGEWSVSMQYGQCNTSIWKLLIPKRCFWSVSFFDKNPLKNPYSALSSDKIGELISLSSMMEKKMKKSYNMKGISTLKT